MGRGVCRSSARRWAAWVGMPSLRGACQNSRRLPQVASAPLTMLRFNVRGYREYQAIKIENARWPADLRRRERSPKGRTGGGILVRLTGTTFARCLPAYVVASGSPCLNIALRHGRD